MIEPLEKLVWSNIWLGDEKNKRKLPRVLLYAKVNLRDILERPDYDIEECHMIGPENPNEVLDYTFNCASNEGDDEMPSTFYNLTYLRSGPIPGTILFELYDPGNESPETNVYWLHQKRETMETLPEDISYQRIKRSSILYSYRKLYNAIEEHRNSTASRLL